MGKGHPSGCPICCGCYPSGGTCGYGRVSRPFSSCPLGPAHLPPPPLGAPFPETPSGVFLDLNAKKWRKEVRRAEGPKKNIFPRVERWEAHQVQLAFSPLRDEVRSEAQLLAEVEEREFISQVQKKAQREAVAQRKALGQSRRAAARENGFQDWNSYFVVLKQQQEERRRWLAHVKELERNRAYIRQKEERRIKEVKYLTICGVRCPPIRHHWYAYARKPGQSDDSWRRMVSELAEKQRAWLEKTQKATRDFGLRALYNFAPSNRFGVLSEEWLDDGFWDEEQPSNCVEKKKKFSRTPSARLGKLAGWGPLTQRETYIAERLRIKKLISEVCWHCARNSRRQRMRRALMVLGNHQVVSLRAALEKVAREYCQQNKQAILKQMQEEATVEFHPFEVQGEMMAEGESATSGGVNDIDQRSNVVIADQSGDSIGSSLPMSASKNAYSDLAAASTDVSVDSFCDRPFTLFQFTWLSSMVQGYSIQKMNLDLPKDIFSNDAFKNSPNFVLFSRHVLASFDLEIELKCNANVRQYGQLQLSFYYGAKADKRYSARNHLALNSQRLHTLLTANFSNDCKLVIPFEYPYPVMYIMTNKIRSLGVLCCKVLVPLTASSTTYGSVDCACLVSFKNVKLQGMVGGNVYAYGQMFSMFREIVVKSLLDSNRDNPTVTGPGLPVIPINSSSWCVGSGQSDYSNILRLDPGQVLPYATGRIPAVDEMKIDYVKKIFGLFHISEWSAQDHQRSHLFSFDALPLWQIERYPSVLSLSTPHQATYAVPPVGVLSSCFAYWRGSLQYRIDIVGCTELTGRLLIAYIPGITYDTETDITTAIACSHTIVDIRENRQINFTIPYVAEQFFYPRLNTVDSTRASLKPPGSVHIFVYNSLIPNATIPDKCTLVHYIAGGDDFELSVPASPNIGLAFNRKILYPDKAIVRIVPTDKSTKMFAGTYSKAISTDDKSDPNFYWNTIIARFVPTRIPFRQIKVPVMAFGTGDGDLAEFIFKGFKTGVNWAIVGQITIRGNYRCGLYLYDKDHRSTYFEKEIKSLFFWCPPSHEKVPKIYACPIMDDDQKVLLQQYNYGQPDTIEKFFNLWAGSFAACVTTDWEKLATDRIAITIKESAWWSPENFGITPVGNYSPPTAQMDERVKVEAPALTPQKNAAGAGNASKMIFGETFLDIKDYVRRYQLYATDSIEIAKAEGLQRRRTIVLKMPVFYQGLQLDLGETSDVNEYFNRNRDGPIPIFASGYRFGCGGIRFRICLNIRSTDSPSEYDPSGKVFVQHRPDIFPDYRKVVYSINNNLGSDDIEMAGYASYHQFDNLNNVLSVEVPFYVPALRNYLQYPDLSIDFVRNLSSLGELVIGLTVYDFNSFKLSYDIYYSLADDARFSVFSGFPSVFDITKIVDDAPPSYSRTAPLPLKVLSVAERLRKASSNSSFSNLSISDSEGQMGLSNILGFGKTVDKMEQLADSVNPVELKDTLNNVNSISSTLKEAISSFVPSLQSLEGKFHKYVDLVINAVTNLAHIIVNFNLKSIGIGVMSFFAQLKLFSYSAVSSIADRLSSLFTFLHNNKDVDLTQQTTECLDSIAEAQMSDPVAERSEGIRDNLICSYISSLIAGVAGFFNVAYKMSREKTKCFSEIIFDGIGKFAFTANHLFTFIKNNLIAIKRMAEYIFGNHPSVSKLSFLKDQEDGLYLWATDVLHLTDPRMENKVFCSARFASKVYLLSQQANLLQIKMLDLKLEHSQTTILNLLIKKISDLKDKLARHHMAPPVRFEPFVLELHGSAGIGKSELLRHLPYRIFKLNNMTHEGNLIYYRTLGTAFWNNLRNEPVCVIDEKFPVKTQEFLGVQLAELFQLKSSCVFNPNMAHVDDKHVKYNPIIVEYASNNPFPKLAEVLDEVAVNRRRDVLIQVEMKEALQNKYGTEPRFTQLTPEEKGSYGKFQYLRFRYYEDVCKPTTDGNVSEWMDYDEFEGFLIGSFRKFYAAEEAKFRREMTRIQSVLPEEEGSGSLSEILDYKWLDTLQEERIATPEDLKFTRALQEIKNEHGHKSFELQNLRYKYFFLTALNGSLEEKEACRNEILALEKASIKQSRKEEGYLSGQIKAVLPVIQALPNVTQRLEIAKTKVEENICPSPLDYVKIVRAQLNKSNVEANMIDPCPCQRNWNFLETKAHLVKYDNTADHFFFDLEVGALRDYMFDGLDTKFNNANLEDLLTELKSPRCCCLVNEIDKIVTFKIEKCSSDKCLFKDPAKYYEFVKLYIDCKRDVGTCIARGDKLTDHLPLKYVVKYLDEQLPKKIEEHKDVAKQVEQGWFSKFCENVKAKIYKPDWMKYIKRIGIVIALLGFIGMILGFWSHFTGSTPCSLNLPSAGLSSGLALSTFQTAEQRNEAVSSKILDGLKDVFGQAHTSGDYRVAKHSTRIVQPAVRVLEGMSAGGQMDLKQEEFIRKSLTRNTFFLVMKNIHGQLVEGRCVGVKARFALCVDHYWEAWNNLFKQTGNSEMMAIFNIDHRISVINLKLEDLKYSKYSNSSLGILTLPNTIPSFRKITQLFAKKQSHSYVNYSGVIFENKLIKNDKIDTIWHNLTFSDLKDLEVGAGNMWSNFSVKTGYSYEGFSGAGRCGCVLLGSSMESPILGIHVAGTKAGLFDSNMGFADVVYREMFDCLSGPSYVDAAPGEGQMSEHFVDGEVLGLGKVSSRFSHHEKGASKIIPSIFQRSKEFPVYTDVAVMSKNDPRIAEAPFSPMHEGCKYHGMPLRPFPKEDLDLAIEDYQNLILAKNIPVRKPGLLTRAEAIGGIPDLPGYEHMKFDTSEGFPWFGFRPVGARDKKWLFTFDENNHYVNHSGFLDAVLDQKWEKRLNDEIPVTVFTDCLKDCTVDVEKVLQPGKTRIFSMSPVDFTIQQRQCTLDFVVSFMHNRRKLEHMIGCNPNSVEWTFLAQDLLEVGDAISTGDYSKFGDTIPFDFIKAAFKIIANWYRKFGCFDPELHKQLEIFPYEIGNSIHIMFNHLYQCGGGQPSGNSMTVIINTIANSLYLRCCWLEIMRNTVFNSLSDFHKYVRMFSYGDDLIVSLSPVVKDLFNASHWQSYFMTYGLKFTNADKSGEIVPYTSLLEADFLKQGFLPHPYRKYPMRLMLASLATKSIEDTPNWIREESCGRSEDGKLTLIEMCVEVSEASVRNAFGRGPDYYSAWREKIIAFWQKRGRHLTIDTWAQLDRKVFDFGFELMPYFSKFTLHSTVS